MNYNLKNFINALLNNSVSHILQSDRSMGSLLTLSGSPFFEVRITTENTGVWASVNLPILRVTFSESFVPIRVSPIAEHIRRGGPIEMQVLCMKELSWVTTHLTLDDGSNWSRASKDDQSEQVGSYRRTCYIHIPSIKLQCSIPEFPSCLQG